MKKYIGKYKKEGLPGGPNEVETIINGFIITNEGQWKYPGQPTLIPSNEITMQGVDFPVLGIDDTGHSKMMMPGADYTFPGSMVYELPMAQSGKTVSQNWQEITGTPWSKAKELGLTTGKANQNVELQKKFLADPEYYRNLAQGREDVATVKPISVEQVDQPIASSISRENVPMQDQYRNVRQQEPENIIGAYNITPYGAQASPYTISDPRLLQLPTMVTDFENETEGSFIGEGSWSRLGAVPLTSTTGEFAQEYFDPLTGEATGEFIPTVASSTLTASGPNAYRPAGSICAQDQCAAGMQYNLVPHLDGGWDELKTKLGITGDAWTMNENILNSGGQRIYGLGTDMDIDRSKKYSSKQVRDKLYEARKKHNLDAVYESAQVGDIVEMYYPNSSSQEEAIRTGKGDTYTTHIGHVTEKDGVKYVTHNIGGRRDRDGNLGGTFHTDKLETLLKRSGAKRSTNGTIVSGIIRPNYGWRNPQSGAVSISQKPVQAIASSGDRNYYTTEDQEKVSNWQSKAITPVARQFVQGLESVAPDIAADFGLSNDQLSLIMRASFGAFGSESGFGESDTYKKKTRNRRVIRGYKNIAPDWMPESDEQSEGLSQIKLENAFNDPKAKALLKKYGIKEVDQLYDPMYSSIATMLLTAMNYKQFESATGLKAEDVDPITMQNIMLLAHNKGMQNVINNDFVEEGKFKKLHQLRRKGHKYVEGQEPKLSDQSILDGLSTYADIHMNRDSYTNKAGDFAASLNIDMPRLFAEKGDREAYIDQEAPEAYSLGETLLDQAYGLLREDYAGDKEKLLAAIESAKIKAIKNAENLYKGSKQKLSRALSKIERDSRKAINEIQNAGGKAVNRVRSTFEEGGNVNNKIYIGQYTMGPNKNLGKVKFQNGGSTNPTSNLPKAQIGKYIPTWANPNNWGVEDYTDKYKTWDEAYAAAKKAGLTEIMWNKGPNPGRKNLEYAGTPRQEVGAYGIKGKPVHSSDPPIQINKYDALNENYLPGHISAGYVGRQPSLTNRTSVNKTSQGTNKRRDYKADQNLFVYDSRLNPENVRPGYNFVTNNCADAVCDALSLSDRDAIETPSGVVEKLLNSQEHPSLDVTGRTYGDYEKKLLSDKNILDNAKYWLGIASSPDNRNLSKLIIRTIQANLSDAGYELPKSRRAYRTDDFFGQFDGVFGDETKAALLDYQNKSKQPKDLGKVSFQNGGPTDPPRKSIINRNVDIGPQTYYPVAESTGTLPPVFQSKEDTKAAANTGFFNQTVQAADKVAAITGDKPNYEQAQQTVITGKQPEFVVNRDDPKYLERAEAYRNKYGIDIDEPTALERLANPMAQMEYYNRYGEFPNRAQMNLESTYGNPMDLAGAIYNPFSYVESGVAAYNAASKENYGEAALSGLGVLPGYYGIQGARALARQASPLVKNAGKFLTTQTPKQLPGSGAVSSADDIGKQFIKAANDRTMPMRPGLKDTTLEDEFLVLSEMSKVSNGRSVVPVHGYTDGNLIMDDLVSRGYVQVDEFIKQGGKINQTSINTLKNDINLWHNNNIIHGDLKSNNAFYNPKTQEIKLIDPVGYPKGFKSTNPKEYGEAIIKDIDDFDRMFPASAVDDVGAGAVAGSEPRQIIPPDFKYGGFIKYPNGDEQLLTAQFGGMRRGKVNRILNDNRDLNFVDRMYQPNTPSIMIPGQNSPSTHFMESADGKVYPTVVQMPDGSLQYLGDDAYNYAMETGQYIEFPNDRQARRFAKSYKKGTGVLDEFSSGGLKQWFAEDWVDIKTGKKCGRGKDEKGRPYPACRPSNRVNETTPKTSSEMSASEKSKFRREKRSSKRISYNHKRNNR